MSAKTPAPKRATSEHGAQVSIEGRKVAAQRHAGARDRIAAAMTSIEKAMIANDGIYPESRDGKVTQQTVLAVAKLSPAYFGKTSRSGIASLNRDVKSWLERIGKVSLGNVAAIRSKVTAKAVAARAETDEVKQRYAEAELEYAATLLDLKKATDRIRELEKENQTLRKQIGNVIPIGQGRKR